MHDLTSPAVIRAIMNKYSFHCRKSMGQNFLADGNIIKKIIDAAEISPQDTVIEIGPGLGVLTQALCGVAARVITVELDQKLVVILKDLLADCKNLSPVAGDAMEVDFDSLAKQYAGELAQRPYKMLSNLPYYITTPLLLHIVTGGFNYSSLVVMIQQEVAQRIAASPGSKDYGSLSVAVQYYTVPDLLFKVPPTVFIPRPEVGSAVLRMVKRDRPPVEVPDEKIFFKIVRGSFAQRRKTLHNALSAALPALGKEKMLDILNSAGVNPGRRGETLSLEEFAAVTREYIHAGGR